MSYFQFTTAAERHTYYAGLVSLAKSAGFDVTGDETAERILLTAEKDINGQTVSFRVTIQRPNIRVAVKGHGRTREGRIVHLRNADAVRTFIVSNLVNS